ncbi:DUF2076 domain-containing protein [Bradyrhizobium sp.]|jgi:hypothetical protein|uniref:DUF2076 domain-containing protein n=1 Tax=Bradyrhizobium sp. TaxID=376 RepID=UPI002C556CC3|nr:DUF2076 domain-containing protein [Bradyrhizobium sp.]HWX64449.1 DUF2076 domain-containing protein [Bradyrhizobium sp.]
MTPQERQLVDDLFDRLAKVESAPRDPNAAAAIAQGLQQAPNAVYALVQTVLLQDEALKRANSHIQELEAAVNAPQQQGQSGGFLDSMREAVFGPGQTQGQARGSVPNVPPPQPASRPVWNSGQVLQQSPPGGYDQGPHGQPPYGQYGGGSPYGQSYGAPPFGGGGGGGGGSFLGTAAAAAAGVVGGSLLLNSIRGMMGGSHQGFADAGALGDRAASPWSDQSNSQLARDAGVDDVGRGGRDNSNQGLFDQASDDNDRDGMMDADADDFDGDDGSGNGSDYA